MPKSSFMPSLARNTVQFRGSMHELIGKRQRVRDLVVIWNASAANRFRFRGSMAML